MEADTTERPSWMTSEFIEATLRTREGFDSVKVVDLSVHLAVGKGENYTSLLYRVTVSFKRRNDAEKIEETRLIIKTLSSVEFMSKFLSEGKIFCKETTILQKVIPAMAEVLREKAPEREYQPFSAHCYTTSRPHTLILEDLTTLGCKMADRHSRLDLNHSVIALKGLARFHAISVALNISNPSLLDDFRVESIYTEKNRDLFSAFVSSTMTALTNVVKKWAGFEKYPDRIQAVIPTMFDRLVEIVKPKENSFNVLTHGDCWVNNMLFHYCKDTGVVDGVRFVDFQLSRYSSPALDLQYFIYTSPNEDVRSQKLEHLVDEYHKELVATLNILGLDPEQYSLEQLKKDFDEKAFFGFVTATSVLSAVLADPEDAWDMERIMEDSNTGAESVKLEKTYSCARYKDVFQKLLPHFLSKGVI